MIKKLILLFLCLDLFAMSGLYFWEMLHPPQSKGYGVEVDLKGSPTSGELRHRPFTMVEFPTAKKPSALIVFGSGDSGWGAFEEAVSRSLQARGYMVIGIDCSSYAKTDYDLATLQADYSTIIQKGLEAYQPSPPPVIVGGWSMGAAQAIAVGGGPNPPPGLVGLLLVSPCSRGRYGLRFSDRIEILPQGPGTFATADFSSSMKNLRIAQWHGGNDTIDSTAWLSNLKATHREYDFPTLVTILTLRLPPSWIN